MSDNIRTIHKHSTHKHMNKNPSSESSDGGGNNGGNTLEIRVTRLEVKVDHIQSDLTEVKAKLERIDQKFDAKFDRLFYWILGTLVSSITVPIILHLI